MSFIRRRSSRRPRPSRDAFSWRALAFEVFAVVLGVTLALGAAELRQHFADGRRVAAATESIAAELEQNCKRIERAQAYHELVIGELDSLLTARPEFLEGASMETLREIPSWNGYNPAFLTASAYETARSTGALELMSYDRALGLGNYYTFVNFYQETVRDALGAVLAQGTLSANQIVAALQLTFELERELGPQSCKGAKQLRGDELSDESTDTSPDTSAAAP